jgi:hypothetical protein
MDAWVYHDLPVREGREGEFPIASFPNIFNGDLGKIACWRGRGRNLHKPNPPKFPFFKGGLHALVILGKPLILLTLIFAIKY